jgi:hypothetical protein
VTSPLLLALYAFVLGAWFIPTGVFLLLVALPGSLAYGAVVRLRAHRRPPAAARVAAD